MSSKYLYPVCLLVAGVGSFVYAAVIGAQMLVPPRTMAGVPTAPTVSGWIQLAIAAIGGFGLTGASLVQAIKTMVIRFMPGSPQTTVTNVVDFAQITALMVLVGNVPDGPAKDSLNMAGRACFDEMRDNVFPASK
jgi:hypothetical protein